MAGQPLKIVFFGTPDFATESLSRLVAEGYDVAAVVTAPDKPVGRGGKQLSQSSVKQFAVAQGLRLLQPERLRSPEFIGDLEAIGADLFIIVAFRMLPELVWRMPPLGTFNIHGSLLPKYRGAAPINWAIINGETETGVTSFFLKHEIDTGNLLFSEKTPIGPDENFEDLYNRMKVMGADLCLKTVRGIAENSIKPFEQEEHLACHAPKLTAENTELDFRKTCTELHNQVRGLSPIPAAWTRLHDLNLKIFRTKAIKADDLPTAGSIATDQKSYLRFACADGWLDVLDLQLSGKKRMDVKSFLNGYKI